MKIWIHLNGVQEGPFDFDTLPSDRITPQTPVWHSGLEYWVEASKCPELAYLFVPKPEPEPVTVPELEKPLEEITVDEPATVSQPKVESEDIIVEETATDSNPEVKAEDPIDQLVGIAEHMAEAVASRAQMEVEGDEELEIEAGTEDLEIDDTPVDEPVTVDQPEEDSADIDIEPTKTEHPIAEEPVAEQPQPAAVAVDENSDTPRPWKGGRRAQFPQGPQFEYSIPDTAQPIATYIDEVPQQPSYNDQASHKKPKSYIVWSILLTLFCVNPLGIIAFVYGLLVSKRYNNFDYEGAEHASEMAQWWLAITIVTGLISLPFMSILNL